MSDSALRKFESVIEERLAGELGAALHSGVRWETQRPIVVDGENFRADLYITHGDSRVVVECDGKAFHDYGQDLRRDVVMLNSGVATEVYRVRGCDIVFAMNECMDRLGSMLPHLFDAERVPLRLEESVMNSVALRHGLVKPLCRARVPLEEVFDLGKELADVNTYACLGRTTDRAHAVVQFKSPYWDWKFEGPRCWHIGDYLAFVKAGYAGA